MTSSAHWAVAPFFALLFWCLLPFIPIGIGLANLDEEQAPYLIAVGAVFCCMNVVCTACIVAIAAWLWYELRR